MAILKLCFFIIITKFAQCIELPQQIHILFRHGERAPTSTYPNDPHKNHRWEGGLGYLTNRGKLQIYTLGQSLRTYYKDFLPKYYWPVEVNFTSSYSDRCLMSAELMGAGMFPPEDFQMWSNELLWQPIPIHYLPRNLDNLIAMKTNCTKYDKEFIEVNNSSEIRQFNQEHQNLYKFLTENTGMNIDNIEAVETLYNTLEIQQLNNLTLPFWVNVTLMTQMKEIAAKNLAIYSETEYMKRMKGGFFLRTVLNLMRAKLDGDTLPSVNMYSGHDLTLVHILRALDLVHTIKPDFGAFLIFELYKNSELKVFYSNVWDKNIEQQNLLKCTTPCTLQKFEKAYNSVLPVNWTEECKVKT